MRTPRGLRSHTPISHTASTPSEAIASHCSSGTVSSVMTRLFCRLKSLSHTHVLISWMTGRTGQDVSMPHLQCFSRVCELLLSVVVGFPGRPQGYTDMHQPKPQVQDSRGRGRLGRRAERA